jgi:two-component system, cell cycle sensor histidine kinase and response regulator CckA
MKKSLDILYLEDNALDAELVRATLAAEDIQTELLRVETQVDFVAALERGGFDLILSDYNLPGFDGISALAIAREKCPQIPFIFVSGSLGEERAIETLKSGATDYVLKHRLSRLVPSVRRALDEVAAQRERKHLEEQLRQSQKMEAIGRLAGGIAHDFNNLLTAIIGYSQLLLSRLNEDDPMRMEIVEIEKSGRRAASLTSQLLAFSRKQVIQPRVLDLNSVISDLDKMLRRVIGEDIDLINVLNRTLAPVKMDPGQVEQIIMNLAVNGRDAMPRGGRLIIETRNVEFDEHFTESEVLIPPGSYVLLSVSDTGCGMDIETQARIFEPFFTTKPAGKGTGLGLSTVYGIVKQSGGDICFQSEPGRGTTFRVYLPTADGRVEAVSPRSTTVVALPSSETILIVEDEETVRKLTHQVLKMQGYTVLEACDGTEALSICDQQDVTIDLMLTDVVMPRISGAELAKRALSMRPEMKVMCMSGYPDTSTIDHGEFDPSIPFLQKPFTPSALARKVREVLDGR